MKFSVNDEYFIINSHKIPKKDLTSVYCRLVHVSINSFGLYAITLVFSIITPFLPFLIMYNKNESITHNIKSTSAIILNKLLNLNWTTFSDYLFYVICYILCILTCKFLHYLQHQYELYSVHYGLPPKYIVKGQRKEIFEYYHIIMEYISKKT